MTILGFLALCIFFAFFFLGNKVYFEDKKNPINRTFALGCFTTSLTIFVIFMTLQSHSATEAFFWIRLQGVVFFIMPFFLHYVLMFTNSLWLKYKLTYIFVYLPPLILTIIHSHLAQLDPGRQTWGYTYHWRNIFWMYLKDIWIIIEVIFFVVLCFTYSLRATGEKKTQAKYLCLTFVVFVFTGIGVCVIAGILNIKIPLELIYIIVALPSCLIILFLMRRYKLFAINPVTAAGNIISTMNESLILLDLNNRIVYLNQAAQNLLGFTEKELVGYPVHMVLSDATFLNELVENIADGNTLINYETEFKTNQGEKVPISISGSILKDKKGNSGGVVIVARDISERKRVGQCLKESAEKYRLLIENAGEAICIVDHSGNIEYMNSIAKTVMGIEPDNHSGKTLWDLFPKNLADKYIKGILDVLDSQKGVIKETTFFSQNRIYWYNVNLQLIPDSMGVFSRVQIIANDITKLKQTEEILINQAQKIAKSNTELQEFIFIASHSLQEPLQKITAFAIRIDAFCFEAITEQGRDYMFRLQKAVMRMQTLIDDLLVYSQASMKANIYVAVNLSQIIREVVLILHAQIEQTGGVVEISSLPTIKADPADMRQLFQNLIGNALKFHKQEVPPKVMISSSNFVQEVVPQYEIIVEDNGIGMEEKYLDRIFGVFQRLHGRDEYGGMGIGLAVCKKIVERYDGSIKVESKPDVGSRFIIRIPINPIVKRSLSKTEQ